MECRSRLLARSHEWPLLTWVLLRLPLMRARTAIPPARSAIIDGTARVSNISYNWGTSKSQVNIRWRIVLKLDDGSTYSVDIGLRYFLIMRRPPRSTLFPYTPP